MTTDPRLCTVCGNELVRYRYPSGRLEHWRDWSQRRTCGRQCGSLDRELDDEAELEGLEGWIIVAGGISTTRDAVAIQLAGPDGARRIVHLAASAAAALPQ